MANGKMASRKLRTSRAGMSIGPLAHAKSGRTLGRLGATDHHLIAAPCERLYPVATGQRGELMTSRAWAFIAAVFLATPAAAADWDTCFDASGETAIAACTPVINCGRYKGKDLAAAFGARGVQLKLADKYDRAIADYSQALRLDPTPARYSNRANAKRLKGDIDGSLADLAEAIRLNPDYPLTYVARGLIWDTEKSDPDRAIADYDRAIRLDPMFTSAFTNRGIAYQKKGDREQAIADYNSALAVPPKYTDGQWAHDEARTRLRQLNADGGGGSGKRY